MPNGITIFKPVVQIDPRKHPELAAELAAIDDPRAHAERLRSLATSFLKLKELGLVDLLSNGDAIKALLVSGSEDKKGPAVVSPEVKHSRRNTIGNVTI